MSVDSLDDLFVVGLKEAYYTENQLLEALDELSSSTHGRVPGSVE